MLARVATRGRSVKLGRYKPLRLQRYKENLIYANLFAKKQKITKGTELMLLEGNVLKVGRGDGETRVTIREKCIVKIAELTLLKGDVLKGAG